MERKNIQRPAGWLMAALKSDYRGEEQESQPVRIDSRFRGNDIKGCGNDIRGCGNDIIPNVIANLVSPPEWTSTEKAIKAIKLIQDNLSACISPIPSGSRVVGRGSE